MKYCNANSVHSFDLVLSNAVYVSPVTRLTAITVKLMLSQHAQSEAHCMINVSLVTRTSGIMFEERVW